MAPPGPGATGKSRTKKRRPVGASFYRVWRPFLLHGYFLQAFSAFYLVSAPKVRGHELGGHIVELSFFSSFFPGGEFSVRGIQAHNVIGGDGAEAGGYADFGHL